MSNELWIVHALIVVKFIAVLQLPKSNQLWRYWRLFYDVFGISAIFYELLIYINVQCIIEVQFIL